ncbi:SGNH/GDSL hydrolase family protein [Paenibacillus sp. IB182496]|uniref:SGNH/GDSL hydrolase family protein n=1 Tax=Paenibacillus sabuli TaxID=2772509 RepID=A0A927BPE9_9BACL|nr:SGNH/GDSL hydrolase family protein [Paenibacillus sabuli]MBD2844303.1 SGNH/GDSL hydrolase family protein [Paenibacillus sabuli]
MKDSKMDSLDAKWVRTALLHHTLGGVEREGGWSPQRFTERQLDVYAAQEAQGKRSRCSAGVVMKLRTDAERLKLSVVFQGAARDYAAFDLYVNGRGIVSEGIESFEGQSAVRVELSFAIPLLPGERGKRNALRIVFPQNVETLLLGVEVSAGAVVEPVAKHPRRLLSLGDSITQGMDGRHAAYSYPVQVADFLEMDLLNQGVGGYVFDPDSLDPALAEHYPADLITVAYGTNDWNRGYERREFESIVSNYLDKLISIYPNVPIYVITPIWRRVAEEQRSLGNLHDVAAIIAAVAARCAQVKVIDGYGLVPGDERVFADGTHPNDEGYTHYALQLLKALR